jgi:peroxiredoxin
MNRRTLIFAGVAILAMLLIYGSFRASRIFHSRVAASSVGNDAPLESAPDFELKSLAGRTMKLSDFRGKVVVLNFWATWCAPCRVETPWLVDLYHQYKGQGLEVVGVSMDDGDQEHVPDFVKEMGINYTVLLGTHAVGDAYGGMRFLPQTFFISRDGKIIKHSFGIKSKIDFEDDIKQSLK